MSEKKPARKRLTYKHKTNAVCVTVYHPRGETIPANVRKEIEDSLWTLVQEHKLLISIALT